MPPFDLPDVPIDSYEKYVADRFRQLTQPVINAFGTQRDPAIQAIYNQVPADRQMYVDQAVGAAQRAGLNPVQYVNHIWQTSGFNPDAANGPAKGIAQLNTQQAQGFGVNPTNPSQSLDAGARSLAQSLSTGQVDSSSHQAFVTSLAPIAQAWEQRTGIPASTWLAMAASESNWGKAGNALFGIKGQGTAGGLTSPTWEAVNGQRVNTTDTFRNYNNPNEAFQGFWNFVHDNPRYAGAVQQLQQGNPQGFIQALNQAGYATDPNWHQAIASIAQQQIAPMLGLAPPTGGNNAPGIRTATNPLVSDNRAYPIDTGRVLTGSTPPPSFKDFSDGLLHQFSQRLSVGPSVGQDGAGASGAPGQMGGRASGASGSDFVPAGAGPAASSLPQASPGQSFADWSNGLIQRFGQASAPPTSPATPSPIGYNDMAGASSSSPTSPASSSPTGQQGDNNSPDLSPTLPNLTPSTVGTAAVNAVQAAPSFADWSSDLINRFGQATGLAGTPAAPSGYDDMAGAQSASSVHPSASGPSYNDMVGANSNGQGGGVPSLTSLDSAPQGIQAAGTPGTPILQGAHPLTDLGNAAVQAVANQYNKTEAEGEAAFLPSNTDAAGMSAPQGRYTPEQIKQQNALTANAVMGVSGGDLGNAAEQALGGVVRDVTEGASREVAAPNLVHAAGITDPNVTYDLRPKVVSLDSLTPSHTDALTPHPDFPAGVQPRERSRAGSVLQIETMAKTLNPDALLTDSGQLDRGAPIVGADNVVESGNGRTLALRKARQDVPDRWNAYQQALRDALPSYGLSASDIQGIKDPVLVRQRVTPADQAAFAAEANQSAVLTMAPVEQARQDAARLAPSALGNIQVGEGQSIDAALRSPANLPLIRSFLEAMPANERAQIVTADGALNQHGLVRVKNALFARTFPGAAGQRLASTFLESIDPVLKNVETGIFGALGQLAQSEVLTKTGARAPALSIGEDLAKATDVLARLKQEGITAKDYLAQPAMFVRELTPTQEQILIHLNSLGRAPRQIREFLQEYAQAVEKSPPPAQTSFLGPSTLTKEEILNRVITDQRAGLAPDSSPLFAALNAEHAAEQGRAGAAASGLPAIAVPERPAPPVAPLADRPQLAPEPAPRERPAPSVAPPPKPEPAPVPPTPASAPPRPSPAVATMERPAAAGPTTGTTSPLPGMPSEPPPMESRPPPLSGSQPPLTPPEPPAEPSAPRPSDARAGNILLNKYVSPDVRQVIADAAAKDPQAMEAARRGVIPDATVQQLADAAGVKAQKIIDRWKPGQAQNAETLVALRTALSTKSDEVAALAKTAQGGNPADLLKLQVALKEQQAIQEAVSGTTAEAGRALRSFRTTVASAVQSGNISQMQQILERQGGVQWTQDLAQKLSQLSFTDASPTARYQFLRDAMKPSLKDYLTELWYNSMLSGPHTLAVKTTSETLSLALSPLERIAAAAVEGPLAAVQGRAPERFMGEAPADVVGMVGGIREGIDKFLYTMQHGFTQADVLNNDYIRRQAFKGTTGAVINFPSNILKAGVEMFGHIAESGALNAGAYRIARGEGATGQALADRMAELRQNPPANLMKYATDTAMYRVYQKPPDDFTKALLAVRNVEPKGIPVGRILVPFLQTPVNLLKFGIERSPLGAFNVAFNADKIAAKNPEASDLIGRWLVGSGIGAAIALEVGAGNITGLAPQSPAERDAWEREGKTPLSVRMGDKWVSYGRMEPIAQTITQVASIVKAAQSGKDVQNAVADVALTIAAGFASQPYMQSLSTFMAAIKDPTRAAGLFTQGLASSTVPAAARVVAQVADPTLRQTNTPLEAMQANVPGLSQRLPARLNAFGEERQRSGVSPILTNVLPVGISQATTDPINQELTKYGIEPGFNGKTLRGINLTPQEQTDHQRVSGQLIRTALDRLVADPRYKAFDDLHKAAALQHTITGAKDLAARQYVGSLIQSQGRDAVVKRIQQAKNARLPQAS